MEHRTQRVQVVLATIILFNVVFALGGYGSGSDPLVCCITSLLTAVIALLAFHVSFYVDR
jgi:hypothetical protein